MSELPPRLSEQQKFILSHLANNGGSMSITPLSRALAKEIETNDNENQVPRIRHRDTSRTGIRASHYTKSEVVGYNHSSSFARSLNRLENRELISSDEDNGIRQTVMLTGKGEAVGEEILRRCSDGRYNLDFNTIDT